MAPESLFVRPTSVFLYGTSGPLLHWLAYAFALGSDPGFVWTDVRSPGEQPDESDPLSRGLVPPDRLNVLPPGELARSGVEPNAASAPATSPPPTVGRMSDFLRLPLHTQRLLAGAPRGGQPMVLVLSNSQRMVGRYPMANVAPVIRTIVDAGTILFVSYVGARPEGRDAFSTVLKLQGDSVARWTDAAVRVEAAGPIDPLPAGTTRRLAEIAPVAQLLTAAFPGP